jgi:hypothetical protein
MFFSAFNQVLAIERRDDQCDWLIKISKKLLLPRGVANFSFISPFITSALRNGPNKIHSEVGFQMHTSH